MARPLGSQAGSEIVTIVSKGPVVADRTLRRGGRLMDVSRTAQGA